MPSPHPLSGVQFPTEHSVRFYYKGRRRVLSFSQRVIDAQIECLLEEDPSCDDTPLGRTLLQTTALKKLALAEMERQESLALGPADFDADAANADVLIPIGTVVRLRDTKTGGRVCATPIERGVRLYDVDTSAGGVISGLLYKEIELPPIDE